MAQYLQVRDATGTDRNVQASINGGLVIRDATGVDRQCTHGQVRDATGVDRTFWLPGDSGYVVASWTTDASSLIGGGLTYNVKMAYYTDSYFTPNYWTGSYYFLRYPGSTQFNTHKSSLIATSRKVKFGGVGHIQCNFAGGGGNNRVWIIDQNTATADMGIYYVWLSSLPSDNYPWGAGDPPGVVLKVPMWYSGNIKVAGGDTNFGDNLGQRNATFNITGDYYFGVMCHGYDFGCDSWMMSDVRIYY